MRLPPSLLALTCLALTACANNFETVAIQTTAGGVPVAGAQCSLSNAKGNWTVITPGTTTVHLGSEPLGIDCVKQGYAEAKTAAHSSVDAGNILLEGTYSTIDGSAWTYPQMITVPMQPLPATPTSQS